MPAFPDIPVHLTFRPISWTLSLHTARKRTIKIVASLVYRYQFRISDAGNVSDTPLQMTMVRGPYRPEIRDMPEDALGFIAYSSADQLLSAGCSLAEETFDELWMRLNGGADQTAEIHVGAVPLDVDYNHDVVWDRQQARLLFITEVEFSFTGTSANL